MPTDGKSLPQRSHCFFRHLPRSSELLLNYKGLPVAIHNAHTAQGEHKHFMEASTPRLQQVMEGIQREQAIKGYANLLPLPSFRKYSGCAQRFHRIIT